MENYFQINLERSTTFICELSNLEKMEFILLLLPFSMSKMTENDIINYCLTRELPHFLKEIHIHLINSNWNIKSGKLKAFIYKPDNKVRLKHILDLPSFFTLEMSESDIINYCLSRDLPNLLDSTLKALNLEQFLKSLES